MSDGEKKIEKEMTEFLAARLEAAERLYLESQATLARARAQRDELLVACEALIDAFGPEDTWFGKAGVAFAKAIAAIGRVRDDR